MTDLQAMAPWLVMALFAACRSAAEPALPRIEPAPVTRAECEAAEARLVELGCPEARTPDGTPFGEACWDAAQDGRHWRPDCIVLVTSCDQVERAAGTWGVCP